MDGDEYVRKDRERLEKKIRGYRGRPGIDSSTALTMLLGSAFVTVRPEHQEEWEDLLLDENTGP